MSRDAAHAHAHASMTHVDAAHRNRLFDKFFIRITYDTLIRKHCNAQLYY